MSVERFIEAQDEVWETVIKELTAGKKETHWMWFVFPQEAGLSSSEMGKRYALQPGEAAEYVANPVLVRRMIECRAIVLSHMARGRTLEQIFGEVDARKFRSSRDLLSSVLRKRT